MNVPVTRYHPVIDAALQSWDLYYSEITHYTGERPSMFFLNRTTFDALCKENGVDPLKTLVAGSTLLGLPIQLDVLGDGRVGVR